MTTHSEFSPSKAHRWLYCPKSIELERGLPNTYSVYATEGSLAHKVCENLILNKGKLSLPNIDDVMLNHCKSYYNYFINLKPVKYWVEAKIDLSCVIPDTYGYCDLIVIDKSNEIHIIDFKYGAGVSVDVEGNEQMIMYALGVAEKLKAVASNKVHLHIHQPRINNISQHTLTVGKLKEQIVKYKNAYTLANGVNAPLKAGVKQCKFCKVKAKCPELLRILKKVKDIMNKELITEEEVVFVLDNVKLLTEFMNNVEIQALKDALSGKKINGYKIVEGRSARVFKPEAEQIMITNIGDKTYSKKMIGITEASKLLPKETMNAITFKPQGKPTLAKESDKRLEYGKITENMFESK